MLYGETGSLPISMLTWLLIGPKSWRQVIISGVRLCIILHFFFVLHINSRWLDKVKSVMDNIDLSNIWYTQNIVNTYALWLKHTVKLMLSDQFKQEWNYSVTHSNKAYLYQFYKTDFFIENYLLSSLPNYYKQ